MGDGWFLDRKDGEAMSGEVQRRANEAEKGLRKRQLVAIISWDNCRKRRNHAPSLEFPYNGEPHLVSAMVVV